MKKKYFDSSRKPREGDLWKDNRGRIYRFDGKKWKYVKSETY